MLGNRAERRWLRAHGFGMPEERWLTEYNTWPIREGLMAKYGQVGRMRATSPLCGRHLRYTKCSTPELHNGQYSGCDFWHNSVLSCHNYRCCVCWKWDWAVHAANSIDSRFATAETVLGLPVSSVEHLSVSLPQSSYGLSYNLMCREAFRAARASGVEGGVTVFHARRKDRSKRDLHDSFHFHLLGYLKDSYDLCRFCTRNRPSACWSCDGFEGVTRRAHVDDGYIVSLARNENGVVEKRKDIFGTAWYQAEHASYERGARRFPIIKWFGNMATNRFKTVPKKNPQHCEICGGSLEAGYPLGVEGIIANRGEYGS